MGMLTRPWKKPIPLVALAVFSSRLPVRITCLGISHRIHCAWGHQLPKLPWDLTQIDMCFMGKNTGHYTMGKERREKEEGQEEGEETKRDEKEG